MKKEFRFRVIAGAALFALLVTAAMPLVALAQDETSTPTPTLESSATPTEEPPTATPDPATATETPVVPSETPTSTSGLPSETATETPSETPTVDLSASATATLSSETPTETPTTTETPTVTPTLGAPIQSSAFTDDQALWCPASVAVPQEAGGMGCTLPSSLLIDVWADLLALDPNVDGTIWIGRNYFDSAGGNDTIFDGSAFSNMYLRKLTVKGGWTGMAGTIDTSDPSLINHRFSITGWANDVNLNTFSVNGDNAGIGLTVYTSGNITTSRVGSSSANGNLGADFANIAGTGNVTLATGTFSGNGGTGGLAVASKGNISLSNITATGNTGYGASLTNNTIAGKTVTLTGTNSFDSNTDDGLRVSNLGNISVSGASAGTNAAEGLDLNNYVGGTGTGNVSVTGGSFTNNNGDAGLQVNSNGTITITSITGSSNTGVAGVALDNSAAPSPKTVTFMGTSEISFNDGPGLTIASDGLVTLKDVSASFNGINDSSGSGVSINNAGGTGGVTLTGTSIFSGNYFAGISISTAGAVSANNVIANANTVSFGASITNSTAATAQPVTFTGTNSFNYNVGGLSISSNGAVTLNNITANANSGAYGVQIVNANAFVSAVKITGTNSMIENFTHGLSITSRGAVTLNSITADDNGQGGIFGRGVVITNNGVADIQTVSLTGVNAMSNNYQANLEIYSNGAVTVNSLTANNSLTGDGATIVNTANGLTNSKKGITLTGTNVLNDNELIGLNATSFGPIKVSSVTANSNGDGMGFSSGRGALLVNESADTPQAVTLSGINTFNSNYSDGLLVATDGLTTASSVTASLNGAGTGVTIDSDGAGATGGVTFTGTSAFNGNQAEGLYITTSGVVTLANVTANSSVNADGAFINNTTLGDTMGKNVTISGVNTFNTNFKDGLRVFTYGDIAVNSVTASGNGISAGPDGDGIDLSNANASTTIFKKITLTGSNVTSDNFQFGAKLVTDGAIAVANLTASGNGEPGGARLDNNDQPENTAGITLTGTNKFNANDGTGLVASSNGPIAANSITASGNLTSPGHGVSLNNLGASTDQKVTLTGTNVFSDNNNSGLYVESDGAVTLNSITANGNDDAGVNMYNNTGSTAQPFALTGTNVINANDETGINVTSSGTIAIANLTANENGTGGSGSGANLSNYLAGGVKAVTFTGTNTFSLNNDHGLLLQTHGLVTSATKLTANGNGDRGLFISNNIDDAISIAGITLSGINIANENGTYGMQLSSYGPITVNNVTAGANGQAMGPQGSGLFIVNNWDNTSPVPTDVKLTGTNSFLANRSNGLDITTYGNISLNSVTSSDTLLGQGAALLSSTEGKTLTMTGNNYFNNNFSNGLNVSVLGNISINNLNASFNGDVAASGKKGAQILNFSVVTPRTVTLTGTNVFIGNYENGLEIVSKGAITLNNVRAHNNGTPASGTGTYVDNAGFGGTPGITLNGINSFRNNKNQGLQIDSDGVVTVNKVTVENTTAGDGLYVEPSANAITLMCGTFTNNFGNGYDVTTSGLLKLVGVLSSGNAGGNANEVFGTKLVVRNCP